MAWYDIPEVTSNTGVLQNNIWWPLAWHSINNTDSVSPEKGVFNSFGIFVLSKHKNIF